LSAKSHEFYLNPIVCNMAQSQMQHMSHAISHRWNNRTGLLVQPQHGCTSYTVTRLLNE